MNKPNGLVTHDGPFHADEVLAVAYIDMIYHSSLPLCRTRDQETINRLSREGHAIIDVGGVDDDQKLRFDHHQPSFNKQRDGIKLSSFGLVYSSESFRQQAIQYFGSQENYEKFYDSIVREIDAIDNGHFPKYQTNYQFNATIGQMISFHNSLDYSQNERFNLAVDFAMRAIEIIARNIRHNSDQEKLAVDYINTSAKWILNDKVCVIDTEVKMKDIHKVAKKVKDSCLLAIYPGGSANDQWNIRICTDLKINPDLKTDDILFIHNAGFVAAAKTKESAIILATRYIEQSN